LSSSLQLIFCGTPLFAVPSLERLVGTGFAVKLAVTQPDRPRGRGMELGFSPVKQRALGLGLPVIQPGKIKNNLEFRAQLEEIQPDAIIVVGYGRIIPQWMIDLPQLGNINVHGSLLPKYRGAAPIQWAIARGESVTGVTTMRIDAGLDTGDILLQQPMNIEQDDTAETLAPRLAAVGADLLITTLRGLNTGTVVPGKQDEAEASLAPILQKEDGRIDFHLPAQVVSNRMRGFQPWPGAFTTFRGRALQVRQARVMQRALAPGALAVEGGSLLAGCAEGTALELQEVQVEGKKRMMAADFLNGYRIQPGERLGV
jgi:methionyl-tRNA formyltransferase